MGCLGSGSSGGGVVKLFIKGRIKVRARMVVRVQARTAALARAAEVAEEKKMISEVDVLLGSLLLTRRKRISSSVSRSSIRASAPSASLEGSATFPILLRRKWLHSEAFSGNTCRGGSIHPRSDCGAGGGAGL